MRVVISDMASCGERPFCCELTSKGFLCVEWLRHAHAVHTVLLHSHLHSQDRYHRFVCRRDCGL